MIGALVLFGFICLVTAFVTWRQYLYRLYMHKPNPRHARARGDASTSLVNDERRKWSWHV